MYLNVVDGDLLEAKDDFIAHQCNCISTNAKTLAELIFNKYDYANSYKKRIRNNKDTYHVPGTIEIFGDDNNRYIINMYAQYYPSLGKFNNDNNVKRFGWFKECLNKISNIDDIQNKTIGMPFNIGCGAAGGDWKLYYDLLNNFANSNKINITLYKL